MSLSPVRVADHVEPTHILPAVVSMLARIFLNEAYAVFDCINSSFSILLALTIVGAIAMGRNPLFIQVRPGKMNKKTGKEKIFKLVKFRTMSNKKDEKGNLLPDDVRLNKYGRILRSTSLDELPELRNIFKGDMAIVGERGIIETTKKSAGFSRVVTVNSIWA